MANLTRDSFTAVPDLPRKQIELPTLGGTACVRRMNAGERSQHQSALWRFVPGSSAPEIVLEYNDLRLAALTLVDVESGQRLFPDIDEGIRILGQHDAKTVDLIVEAARELNPLNAEEVDEAVAHIKATESSGSSSA